MGLVRRKTRPRDIGLGTGRSSEARVLMARAHERTTVERRFLNDATIKSATPTVIGIVIVTRELFLRRSNYDVVVGPSLRLHRVYTGFEN